MKTLEMKSVFLGELGTIKDTYDNVIETIELGDIFESRMNGKLQKFRPFTAQVTDHDTLFTEIVLGYVSEDDQIDFWGVPDYCHRENWNLYPKIKEAMNLLKFTREINGNTCEYCYLAVRDKKLLIDGKFYNSKEERFSELEKIEKEKRLRNKRRKLIFWTLIIIVVATTILAKTLF